MKTRCAFCWLAALLCARLALAQVEVPQRHAAGDDYAADIATVGESQREALAQARQMLGEAENPAARAALQTAIKEMERAAKALQAAKKNPGDLPAAVMAEQAAYQALLKLVPHEFRVNHSRRGGQGSGSGQPGQRQLEQLDMTPEENRYETERQAAAEPTGAQREKLALADRLKQLAQRQQDLNERLRELQTALQQARTETAKAEIQRELKHLADEERQMLSDVDDLKQKLDQSPNASSLSQTARDLDQTRAETDRAAQQLASQAVSQALASGARAQESMRNTRENLRSQTSSQFSSDMRQLRNQARDLARKEDEIERSLEAMANPDHQRLDNTEQQQKLAAQLAGQERALTNLLAGMQEVTEKAESSEPLLSEQLYDTLRRAGQTHTESLLETSGQLLDRGFLAKAVEVESAARTNISDLRQRVEHAADSVLGSQSQALRYAQSELDDLSQQVQRGVENAAAHSASRSEGRTNSPSSTAQVNAQSPASEPSRSASQSGEQGKASPATAGANGDYSPQSGAGNESSSAGAQANGDGGADRLRELVQQIGGANGGAGSAGPIVGQDFVNWTERMRDVEQVLDSVELRNRLATVRERVGAYRADYRNSGRLPSAEALKLQVLQPMTEARAQIAEDIARLENARSLVPLDHDPVPDKYGELVRKYYEKLGGGQ